MAEGFIVISKKIRNWKWWKNPTARSLWIYLLTEANWKDEYDRHGNLIERGSFIRSLRTMEEECGYTVKTIRTWLQAFQDSGEIKVEKVSGYTKITILNYRKYQDYTPKKGKKTVVIGGTPSTTPATTPSTTVGTTPATTPGTTDRTIYNLSNQSNLNNHIGGAFTPPTVEEVRRYVDEAMLMVDPEAFVDFYSQSGWKLSNGNKMKDWKAACRNWHHRREEKKNSEDRYKGWAF